MAGLEDIQIGDLIEYCDGPHTFHVKALVHPRTERVQVESTITPGFEYSIDLSMIVSVQRVVPGEGTVTVYQKEVHR